MEQRRQAEKIDGRQGRGEATRRRLLDTAVVEFGRLGFDAVSTRALANAAGVNLQAIGYHFGDKRGLHLAAVGDVRDRIRAHIGDLPQHIAARLARIEAGEGAPKPEARAGLVEIARTLLSLFSSPESDPWVQLVLREQAAPTEAFDLLYQGFMVEMLSLSERLLGLMLEMPPGTPALRLRLMALFGSALVFRTARATLRAQMGWAEVGPEEAAQIVALAEALVPPLVG